MVWGLRSVQFAEAKAFVGQRVTLSWIDDVGKAHESEVEVYQVTLVQDLGPSFVTDHGLFAVNRVTECRPVLAHDAGTLAA